MKSIVNLIKRLFVAFWKLLSVTRSIIVNLIFFGILFVLFAASTADTEQIIVPEGSALVLNIVGDVVEQKREINPIDALVSEAIKEQEENPEVLVTDITKAIAHAKNDDRVKILVLQLSGMRSVGLSKLQDIGAVLEDFKSSGKAIVALSDTYSQDQYYLASHADKLWLNPEGFMLFEGYGRYGIYFKSALEKLSINQHVFKVGTYKSAVEPFIRDDMSDEAKEANKLWLSDLWTQYKDDIAKQRDIDVNNFDESMESLLIKLEASKGNFAEYALQNKWVDELKTREEMRNELIGLVGSNKKGTSFNQVSFSSYLDATSMPDPLAQAMEDKNSSKVAIIVAKGTILNGNQKAGTIGGDSTARLLRKARNNEDVKAVVLRVDSPGGSAFASEIIRQEVELLKAAGKPVVASMGTYAASGGYWISAPADKIIASPATITGSIGIFGMMMTFEDTLAKVGVYTDGVGTTDIAGLSATRPLTENMGKLFQMNVERGYHNFLTLVSENRDMSMEEVDAVAQGRVWSGVRAKELGLVDELGNLDDAVIAAASLAELDVYDTLLVEKERSERDIMIQKIFGQQSYLANLIKSDAQNDFTKQTSSSTITQMLSLLMNEVEKLDNFNDPQGMYILCTHCLESH
ncbi:MAG: signal peptide peptidase SppA [Colwellia sp.]